MTKGGPPALEPLVGLKYRAASGFLHERVPSTTIDRQVGELSGQNESHGPTIPPAANRSLTATEVVPQEKDVEAHGFAKIEVCLESGLKLHVVENL